MTAPEDQKPPKASVELPSYSLEDEEAASSWRRWLRGRRLAVTIAVFVFLMAAIFGAKPLYREAKARRALAIAGEAGQAIDRGDGTEASRLLRQAALMAFQDKRVAARVTFHAARAGDMASVAELGKKVTAGEATSEEALVFGEMSLGARRIEDAEKGAAAVKADELSPDEKSRVTALRAGILHAKQKAPEAEALLRGAIAENLGESSDRLRVMLANALIESKDPASSREAEQLLEQAAKNQGEQGATALRLLCVNRAGLSPEARSDFERSAERLRNHPAFKDEDEIFLARVSLAADPSRSGEISGDLVARLGKHPSAAMETRVAAARLLVSASRFNEALELVSDEDASLHAGALMARLDALSGLQDWEKTSQLIEKNRGGTLPDTLYHLFRARMATVRGDEQASAEEKRMLRQVMAFAEMPHVLFAARYAETVGWKPEALAAWRILAANEGARPDALRAQLRNLPPDAPASEGLGITEELLKISPDDPSVRLSNAYFRLLAGKDVGAAAAAAEQFLAEDKESADLRRVAALGRLRSGQAAEGLAIWPGDGGENRWRALHVALLREAGKSNEAGIALEQVDQNSLGPEEKDLLSTRESESKSGADR